MLDIEIFTVMNNLLKEKVKQLKEDKKECEFQLQKSIEKIEIHKDFIETLEKGNEQELQENADAIATAQASIATHQSKVEQLQRELGDLQSQIKDLDSITTKRIKLNDMRGRLERTVKKYENEITFYNENNDCPTCHQSISDDFKTGAVDFANNKISDVSVALTDLDTQLEEIAERLENIEQVSGQISDKQREVSIEQSSITGLQKYITEVEKKSVERDISKIDEEKEKLEKLISGVDTLNKAKEKLAVDNYVYDVATGLLKDTGIKTRIVRQYLPIINKLVNKYLASMDFFVQFELDEAFNESIRSRYRDDFSYASFSEGEKMRIDLALLFTWRAIAKMKNSVNTNLLILDEVFDGSLDTGGTDEFLKIINTLTTDTNVFIISHKGDQLYDKFHSVVKFEKVKNYSRIAQ